MFRRNISMEHSKKSALSESAYKGNPGVKIKKSIIDLMVCSVPDRPPEIGGILGRHEELVDEIVIDLPNPHIPKKCSYVPNISFLNGKIDIWAQNDIALAGIFHTHYFGVRTLSEGDKKYIQKIMSALPVCVEHLYFPIFVLPENELVCYKAVRQNGVVLIQKDDVVIVE